MIWAEYVRDAEDDDKKWAHQTCKMCGKKIGLSSIWYCKKCLKRALDTNWDYATFISRCDKEANNETTD